MRNLFVVSKYLLLLNIIFCFACMSNDKHVKDNSLTIYAASSLITVLPKIEQAFQQLHPEINIEHNFAASSMLAKQIEHGAGADLFISAHPQWIKYLEKAHQLKKSAIDLLSNKLVLIVPLQQHPNLKHLQDLLNSNIERIALADWTHVPAGIYAKEALKKFEIWEQVQPKCIPALDVRAVLAYVERGEADCGIVYRTDAMIGDEIRIYDIADSLQPSILYQLAILKTSQEELVTPYISFLSTQPAQQIFSQNGFELIRGSHIK